MAKLHARHRRMVVKLTHEGESGLTTLALMSDDKVLSQYKARGSRSTPWKVHVRHTALVWELGVEAWLAERAERGLWKIERQG